MMRRKIDQNMSLWIQTIPEEGHLAVTAKTVLGLALHSSIGNLPRKGSSSETRNNEGVVMWGM